MTTIRVAAGAATGPTRLASYDAALAEANLADYNLVRVSSVIPADAEVEVVDAVPDLGPPGSRLTVVEARATGTGPGHVTAGLAWDREPGGPGIFYEAAGETDEADVKEQLRQGLAAGRRLRDWEFSGETVETNAVVAEPGVYTTAVVLAAYGEGEPIG